MNTANSDLPHTSLVSAVAQAHYLVPNDLVYRIYGDTLAVVMNVKLNRVVLLEKEALMLWKRLLAAVTEADTLHPAFKRLLDCGVIQNDRDVCENSKRIIEDNPSQVQTQSATTQQKPQLDLAVLNLWAFKNHIPFAGHFELTGRCNLRCKHCYCLFEHDKDLLSTQQILHILDQLRDSGTFVLVLTGGEIFFRKDIMEILAHLNTNKFVVRINTNGALIDAATVEMLSKFPNIYRIHISLYGPDARTHDAITHSRGSFAKTLNALKLLKEAGFNLRINCSLMQSNFDSYQQIKTDIADKLGIPVHFDSIIFPKDDGSTDNQAEEINPAQTVQFFKFNAKGQPPAAPKKPKLCKAGFSFFSICEDGSIYPCLKMKRFYSNPLGNLNADSFQHLWENSASIQKIRTGLTDKLRNCNICDLTI